MSVLGLGSCKLSSAAAREIACILTSSRVLTSLNLEFNLIDTDGAAALASALAVNSGLTHLKCVFAPSTPVVSLPSHRLTTHPHTSPSLAPHRSLSEMNRSGDDREDMEGILAIASALEANGRLTNLNLSANSIDVTAGKALAKALSANKALRHLDLSSNRLCGVWPQGVRQMGSYDASCIHALARSLRSLTDLHLCLRGNGLRDTEIQAVNERRGQVDV